MVGGSREVDSMRLPSKLAAEVEAKMPHVFRRRSNCKKVCLFPHNLTMNRSDIP